MSDIVNAPFYKPLCVIWEALRRKSELKKADCIVGFGNYNCDIAVRCAELYREGYAPKILFSGGLGRNTMGIQSISEAERFAHTAMDCGVPKADILIENRSTNTAENISFTRALLEENGIHAKTLIGVHQPFMEKRIASAFDIAWPEVELLTTSLEVDIPAFFRHAVNYGVTERMVIEEVVGDFQRMELYARRGWQSVQELPPEAWAAFEELVRQGYTGQLA